MKDCYHSTWVDLKDGTRKCKRCKKPIPVEVPLDPKEYAKEVVSMYTAVAVPREEIAHHIERAVNKALVHILSKCTSAIEGEYLLVNSKEVQQDIPNAFNLGIEKALQAIDKIKEPYLKGLL